MLIGYARVSTRDQNLDLQIDALRNAGCEKIFEDKISGARTERPGLSRLKDSLRPGDTLIIWRLDRLARSTKDLINWVNWLREQGVMLKSLNDPIDTTSPSGELVFTIFAAVAQFERDVNRERSRAGMEAARERGRFGGRPPTLSKDKLELLMSLYYEKKHSVMKLCEMFEISKSGFYKMKRSHEAKKTRKEAHA